MSGALGKFSDIPYHLITEYIQTLNDINLNPLLDSPSIVDLSTDVDFVSRTNFNFNADEGFMDWYSLYDQNESKTTSTGYYLDGSGASIYARGSATKTSMYVKVENYGFAEIEVQPLSATWIDENELQFEVKLIRHKIPSNTIKSVASTNQSEIVEYDYTYEADVDVLRGLEVYFRKDSNFHAWLISDKPELLDDVNYRKQFLYFGKIFPLTGSTTNCMITYVGLKDFAINVFPTNNMSDRLKALLWTYFDKVYAKNYNLQKNVYSLIDPKEIDYKYIGYFIKQYGIDIDEFNISEDRLREFAGNIVAFLKRKGTYASAYVIWRAIAGINQKSLRIYDRWHKNTITESPSGMFYDFPYTNMYGYKRNYPLYAPDEYINVSETNLESRSSVSAVSVQTQIVSIAHNLNTYFVNVQCYDLGLKRVIPKKIDSNLLDVITLTFSSNFVGYVYVSASDVTQNASVTTNPLAEKNRLVSIFDTNRSQLIPDAIQVTDQDLIIAPVLNGTAAVTNPDYVHVQVEPLSEWRIKHNISYTGSIIDIFDNTGSIMYPREVFISSPVETTVRFNRSVNGVASIRRIGSEIPISDFEELLTKEPDRDLVLSPHYRIDINHNVKPISNTAIMTKDIMDGLLYGWDLIRPAVRVAHYSQTIYPYADFTGDTFNLYPDETTTWKSKYVQKLAELPGQSVKVVTTPVLQYVSAHRLNTKSVIVQCYDENLNRVYPLKITATNVLYATITFKEPFTGTIFVASPDYVQSFSNTETWGINHGLNTRDLLVQTRYTNANEEYSTNQIVLTDLNNATISNYGATSGSAVFILGDYTHQQSSAATIWTINHELDYIGVIVEIYDSNNRQIEPKTMQLVDANKTIVTFNSPVAGYAVVKAIGSPAVKQTAITEITDLDAYFKLGNGLDKVWDVSLNNDIQSTIYQANINGNVSEDDYNYYFNLVIPRSIELNITEVGLFNKKDDIIFYTFGDPLYKHPKTELRIVYKVSKSMGV